MIFCFGAVFLASDSSKLLHINEFLFCFFESSLRRKFEFFVLKMFLSYNPALDLRFFLLSKGRLTTNDFEWVFVDILFFRTAKLVLEFKILRLIVSCLFIVIKIAILSIQLVFESRFLQLFQRLIKTMFFSKKIVSFYIKTRVLGQRFQKLRSISRKFFIF